MLLTYSCQTLIALFLENASKSFPAWPAARNFMLIISDFPIPSPSFLSEVEYWFPQECHIISESGLVISPISPSLLTECFVVVVVFVSKNKKTE